MVRCTLDQVCLITVILVVVLFVAVMCSLCCISYFCLCISVVVSVKLWLWNKISSMSLFSF